MLKNLFNNISYCKINLPSVKIFLILFVIFVSIISPSYVYAQEAKNSDIKSILEGTTYYDPSPLKCETEESTDNSKSWEERIKEATEYAKKLKNKVGFTVAEADSGKNIGGYNQDLRGNIASMLKAFVMAAYLDKYNDQEIPENMKPKLAKMIRESDGDSYNEVKTALGGEGPLTSFILNKLKVPGTAPKDMSAQVSPEQMATGFAHIEEALPKKHQQYGLNLLSSLVKEHQWGMVPAAKATGWNWHVKAGWINNNTHQSGLFFNGSEKVAISIMQPDIPTPNKDPIDKDPVSFKGQKNIEAITRILLNKSTPGSGGFFMVGDSIGEGIKNTLQSKLEANGYENIIIDTAVSRSLTSKGEGQTDGLEAINENKDTIAQSDTVVIQLGTNGDTTSKNIKKAISAIKKANKDVRIYWVNIGTTRNDLDDRKKKTNRDLEKNTDQGYKIIDWSKEIGPNDKDNLLSDNVHPNEKGAKILSNLIVNSAGDNNTSNDSPNTNGGIPNGVGNDRSNPAKVWAFLVSPDGMDLTAVQAAGVMGNIQQESGFDPKLVEGNGIGYGLFQWSFERRTALEAYAKKHDKPVGNIFLQLEYFKKEMTEGYKDVYKELKKAKDVIEATVIFHDGFEKSADPDEYVRNTRGGKFAKKWLNKYGDKTVNYEKSDESECKEDSESDNQLVEGVEEPPNLGKELGKGLYRMPPSKNKTYIFSGGATPDQRCGSKMLVSVIYTAAENWHKKYPKNPIVVGDLNATGHKSHKWGVAVDITVQNGDAAVAGSANRERNKDLAKAFLDTNQIENIWFDDNAIVEWSKEYIKENKLHGYMKSIGGHATHFHVNVLDKYKLKEAYTCPSK